MTIIDFLCRACAWIAVFLLNVLGMDFQCDGVYLVAGNKELWSWGLWSWGWLLTFDI